jgi:hypothetical protein
MAPTTAGTWKPAKERTCRSLAHLFVAFRGKASGGIDRLRYAMPKCGPFAEPKVMVTDGAWQVDEFFLRGSGPHMCQPARHRVVEVGTASRRLRSPSPMVSRCARHRPRTTRSVALYAISPWPRGRLPAACGNLPTDTASVWPSRSGICATVAHLIDCRQLTGRGIEPWRPHGRAFPIPDCSNRLQESPGSHVPLVSAANAHLSHPYLIIERDFSATPQEPNEAESRCNGEGSKSRRLNCRNNLCGCQRCVSFRRRGGISRA